MDYGSAGMDTFILEDRKTIPVEEFEGLSYAMQRRSTWSSLGNAIRQGIHRNR
jgi:hypothetical protein